jgi:hypothetical protein
VPPFDTGKMPVTLAVKSMVLFWMSELTIWPLNNAPPAVLFTGKA